MHWNEIVQNVITKHSDRIRRVTAPLRNRFGVSYFTYHHIDEKGNYKVLVDRPDWAEHYVENKFYLNDPYLRHPEVYQSGFCLIDDFGSDEYKEKIIHSTKSILNMDIGVISIQKLGTSVEFFGMAATKKTSSLETVYFNHPQLLKSFIPHFKRELKDFLHEAHPLPDLKGANFFTHEKIHPNLDEQTKLAYLKSLGFSLEHLTPREKECLKHFGEGKSAKETASLLHLSPRTIESYFENIKNKLSCWSKQDLLEIAKLL